MIRRIQECKYCLNETFELDIDCCNSSSVRSGLFHGIECFLMLLTHAHSRGETLFKLLCDDKFFCST